jgi:GIY-YIG catalytic domain
MKKNKFSPKNNSNIYGNNCDNAPIIPIITYDNIDTNKCSIIEENKNKSGVYRLVNKINGKSYIGSSISLSNRFSNYYYLSSLTSQVKGSIIIYRALLKYGYKNFNLDILEYCESNMLRKREQYYINIIKPEYNILKIDKNNLGSKHS